MAASAQNLDLTDRITRLGEQAAHDAGIEIVEVQLRGSGKARLLRVYIDKPGGVTHGDCELISQRLGRLLDEGDLIPGDSYTLEVSSPGLERRLSSQRDFERVVGQKVKLSLKQPVSGQTRWEGNLQQVHDGVLEIATSEGEPVQVPLSSVGKANLKFDW
jgi:ribosome maturation factor RimP